MGSSKNASSAEAIVALGNPYRTDDGVGVALLRRLEVTRDALRVMGEAEPVTSHPSRVTVDLVEAVHDGLRLAEAIAGYERVLIVDAFPGLPVGEVRRSPLGELPAGAGYPHGLGLKAALEILAAMGSEIPQVEILAIGIPPDPPFGEGLSPEVERALPTALAEVRGWLSERWRHCGSRR